MRTCTVGKVFICERRQSVSQVLTVETVPRGSRVAPGSMTQRRWKSRCLRWLRGKNINTELRGSEAGGSGSQGRERTATGDKTKKKKNEKQKAHPKMVKPYHHLQSQVFKNPKPQRCHVKMAYRCIKFNACCLLSWRKGGRGGGRGEYPL